MQKISRKRIFILLGIAFLVLVIVSISIRGCGKSNDVVYKLEKVTRGEIKKSISVTGNLEVLNSHIITSQIDGIVSRVYVDFNHEVHQGQLIAKIESSGIEQSFLRVTAKLDRSQLDLLEAKRELTSKKNLFKEHLISNREMEFAELNYKKRMAQHKQIQIDYDIAKKNLAHTRILSPVNGIVISRDVEANMPISAKKVLFTIAEGLSKMQLIINIDESDIGYVKKGQDVEFTVSAFPGRIFRGIINQVRFNPVKKGDIVTYQSVVLCNNEELRLKPGMTATATVIVANKENVKRVPSQAFFVSPVGASDETTKEYVWIKNKTLMKSSPFIKVRVETGVSGDHFTEIKSADIKVGDEVLVSITKGK